MDWGGCELVELLSGVSVVKGTSLSADALLSQLSDSRFEEIAAQHPEASVDSLHRVLRYGAERIAWDIETLVDWKNCKLVEQVPGRCSGAPTIIGTRIFPDTIAEYCWSGASIDEIKADYPSLSRETIAGLIAHIEAHELSAA